MKPLTYIALFLSVFIRVHGQDPELKSIEEVISGIDSLLEEIDRSSESELENASKLNDALKTDFPGASQSFRVQNELLPVELRDSINDTPVAEVGMPALEAG